MCAGVVKKAKVSERKPLGRRERRELKKKKRKNCDLISESLQLWEKLRKLETITASLSHTHTRSLSLTHTLYLSLMHTLTLSLSLSHTHSLSADMI